MDNNKLNKKLVIEKALPKQKKKGSVLPIILLIFLACSIIAFLILEKLNYFDYLDFFNGKI